MDLYPIKINQIALNSNAGLICFEHFDLFVLIFNLLKLSFGCLSMIVVILPALQNFVMTVLFVLINLLLKLSFGSISLSLMADT